MNILLKCPCCDVLISVELLVSEGFEMSDKGVQFGSGEVGSVNWPVTVFWSLADIDELTQCVQTWLLKKMTR